MIHTFPPRRMCRVMAIRAASICRLVTYACSRAWMQYSPNVTSVPPVACPVMRPRCCFRCLTLRGINIYPDRPLTKKPAETRMGSGKGSPEWWIANVKPGRVMFELSGVAEPVAREALRRAIHKLPMKCRVVRREVGEG